MARKPAAKAPPPLEERIDEICELIAEGNSLRAACRSLDLKESSVRYWLMKDEAAAAQYRTAQLLGCDALADEAKEIADTPKIGKITTRKPLVVNGKAVEGVFVEEEKTEDMLGHRRLQIDARLRLIGKWNPAKYGDKVAHTGADGGNIKVDVTSTLDVSNLDDDQLRALASIRVSAE